MNKEKWIDDIIQSGKELSPVPANPFLATRIAAKLRALEEEPLTRVVPARWVYVSAVAMLVLLIINVVLVNNTHVSAKKNTGIQQVMQEYGWGNNDLY
jgi:fucose permease